MHSQPAKQPIDPSSWDGDPDQLIGHEDELQDAGDEVCDQLFASKHEAFTVGMFLASRQRLKLGARPGREPQFDQRDHLRWLELIERLSWADMEMHICGLDQGLLLAMEATHDDFALWEQDAEGERWFGDEYGLAPDQVAALDDTWGLAYVARLLRSIALAYGVPMNGFRTPISIADLDSSSPAALLRGLHDISTGLGAR